MLFLLLLEQLLLEINKALLYGQLCFKVVFSPFQVIGCQKKLKNKLPAYIFNKY